MELHDMKNFYSPRFRIEIKNIFSGGNYSKVIRAANEEQSPERSVGGGESEKRYVRFVVENDEAMNSSFYDIYVLHLRENRYYRVT